MNTTETVDGLAPHQLRVVEELHELFERVEKLAAFIDSEDSVFRSLDYAEQVRLVRQGRAMTEYAQILVERIAAFQPTEEAKK